MKRTLAATLAIGLLSACGSAAPAAIRSETPQQSLAATGKEMAKLQSLRFTINGTVTLTLPQALIDQLRRELPPSLGAGQGGSFLGTTTTVALKIAGAAQKPDRLDATVEARIGTITIDTEVIATGGTLYYKDPLTTKWETFNHARAETGGASRPKLSYQAVIDTAKSVTEVSDQPSTLNGVSVEHYRLVPDLLRVFTQTLSPSPSGGGPGWGNPQAIAAIQDILQNANLAFDVWTGTNDHLIRRVSYDADVAADLHQLATAFSSNRAKDLTIPAGSTAHLTAHVVIDLHDFDTTVKIQAPTVTS